MSNPNRNKDDVIIDTIDCLSVYELSPDLAFKRSWQRNAQLEGVQCRAVECGMSSLESSTLQNGLLTPRGASRNQMPLLAKPVGAAKSAGGTMAALFAEEMVT